MAIKIHGSPVTSSTSRVLFTIFEKEVKDWELVNINLWKGEQKQPAFLTLQPFGVVPAMVCGSLTLYESRAIARYLENSFPNQGTPLYGSSPKDKALVEQWLEVEGQNYSPSVTTILWEKVFKLMSGGQTDQAVVDACVAKVKAALDVYEAQLAKSKYLAGEFFSFADLTNIPPTFKLITAIKLGDLIESRPHVKAWYEDISSRPAWKKTLAMAAV